MSKLRHERAARAAALTPSRAPLRALRGRDAVLTGTFAKTKKANTTHSQAPLICTVCTKPAHTILTQRHEGSVWIVPGAPQALGNQSTVAACFATNVTSRFSVFLSWRVLEKVPSEPMVCQLPRSVARTVPRALPHVAPQTLNSFQSWWGSSYYCVMFFNTLCKNA